MAKIKDLPGAGHSFRVNTGAGNFTKKLTSATRAGELRNLRDNQAAILKVIKKNEGVIRRGGFDRLRQIGAWRAVKKLEGSKLTKDDTKEIKQLFKHLGKRQGAGEGAVSKIKIDRALDKDNSFAEERDLDLKKRLQSKIDRFDRGRARTGGETRLKFTSAPEGVDEESLSMSGKVLARRFNPKEARLKAKMPLYRVQWRKEKEKRFEASSLEKASVEREKKMSNPQGYESYKDPDVKQVDKSNQVEKNDKDTPKRDSVVDASIFRNL